MKKILVTGGAGYIGSHTVKELVGQDFDVVVLDSLESGHREVLSKEVVLEVANLADQNKVKEIFLKHKPDAVIDFAAYLAVGESMENPKKYFENNVANFVNLLDAMKEDGCKYLVKSSTAAVYGNPTKESDIPWKESFTEEYQPKESALLQGKWDNAEVIGEEFFQKFIQYYNKQFSDRSEMKLSAKDLTKLRIPLSIYGLSKALDEILIEKYNKTSGIESVALRYFNVCGADPDGEIGEAKPKPTTLVVLAIYQALGKIPELQIFGRDYPTPDGTGVRDYIHPSDLATGHLSALKYLENGGSPIILNLGTGNGSSVLEVISAVEKASGKKIKFKDMPRRSGDPITSVADPSRANKLLDWRAKYNLDDMARTAWVWESEFKSKIIKNKNSHG